jgi:HlyD family secretion protein
LARLDDAVYAADLAQAEAQVQSATAGIRKSEADLAQATARHEQAARDWKRAQDVGPSEALSQAVFDGYQSAFETTRAAVAVAEAAIAQAKAQLEVTEAQRRKAKRNLDFCTIRTPVTGVVIDRRVNIGQTVVASLNAPSLFLLAKDLTRLQVWAQVNEADIGRIRSGQKTRLSVDAFPGESFEGAVEKVRLNASMSQNVVTYTVEVSLDNREGKLLPYLTASVQFEINRKPGVLLVPSSALRWTPSAEQISPAHRTPPAAPGPAAGGPGRPGGGKPGSGSRLWVKEGSFVKPIPVRPGETDGVNTEVEGEGLAEGLEVVTGFIVPLSSTSQSSNPFAPKMMGPGGGSGGGRPSGGRPSGAH